MNNQQNNFSNDNSINLILIYRSLYILKKKLEKYKEGLDNIYSNLFVKDFPDRLNNKLKIIKINSTKDAFYNFLNFLNISLIKINQINEIFVADLISTNKQKDNLDSSVDLLYNFVTANIEKYNKIFFEKKIKPLIESSYFNNISLMNSLNNLKYNNNYNKNFNSKFGYSDYYPIEVNKNDSNRYNFEQMNNDNEDNNNDNENKEKNNNETILENNNNPVISLQEEYENNKQNKDILYIETIPIILADFLQENHGFSIINLDMDDMILNNEIKNLFDNDILSKLSASNSNKNNNIDITDQSKIREEQKIEQQSLEKNIKLYEDLLEEKKKNNESTKYIEDFLEKLYNEKKKLDKKIKEEDSVLFSNNNSLIKIIKPLKSGKIRNNTNINTQSLQSLPEEINFRDIALKEIFNFYARQHGAFSAHPTFDEILHKKNILIISEYARFTSDFNIKLPKIKIAEVYKKSIQNINEMNFKEFLSSLEKLSNEINKYAINIIDINIRRKKNAIKKIQEKIDKIKDENVSFKNDLKEQSALENEIFDLGEEKKVLNSLTKSEIYENFVKTLEIDNYNFRKKMKGFETVFNKEKEKFSFKKTEKDIKYEEYIKQNKIKLKKLKEEKSKEEKLIEELNNDRYKKKIETLQNNNKILTEHLANKDVSYNSLNSKRKEYEDLNKSNSNIILNKSLNSSTEIKKNKNKNIVGNREKNNENKGKLINEEDYIENDEDKENKIVSINSFNFSKIENLSNWDDLKLTENEKQIFQEVDSQNSDDDMLNNFRGEKKDKKNEKNVKNNNNVINKLDNNKNETNNNNNVNDKNNENINNENKVNIKNNNNNIVANKNDSKKGGDKNKINNLKIEEDNKNNYNKPINFVKNKKIKLKTNNFTESNKDIPVTLPIINTVKINSSKTSRLVSNSPSNKLIKSQSNSRQQQMITINPKSNQQRSVSHYQNRKNNFSDNFYENNNNYNNNSYIIYNSNRQNNNNYINKKPQPFIQSAKNILNNNNPFTKKNKPMRQKINNFSDINNNILDEINRQRNLNMNIHNQFKLQTEKNKEIINKINENYIGNTIKKINRNNNINNQDNLYYNYNSGDFNNYNSYNYNDNYYQNIY